MPKRLTVEQFVERSIVLHGNVYDYSRVEYRTTHYPVKIVCPIHGEFEQLPESHLKGCGCPRCAGVYSMCQDEFVKTADKIHGGKFDYSATKFTNVKSKIDIICPKHGLFSQLAKSHLEGSGCLMCRNENYSLGTAEFTRRASVVHSSKYTYDQVNYIDNHTKVDIKCPIHGVFSQQPRTHLKGKGCPHCSKWVSIGELEFLSYVGIPMTSANRQVRVGKYFVDGLMNNTVYEFLGDYWHGNPNIYDATDINKQSNQTFGRLYRKTLDKLDYLIQRRFVVKIIWESDWNKWKTSRDVEIPIIDYQSKNPLVGLSNLST